MKKQILRWLVALQSWKTHEKIVVLESDDWGTERMSSTEALNALSALDGRISADPFCVYDTIEQAADLERFFDVLLQFRDAHGRHPVITANVCMANPDFKRIAESDFQKFFYEHFSCAYQRRPETEQTLDCWQKGIEAGVFFPQLHGREHVHALAWMDELQKQHPVLTRAFEWGVWGIPYAARGVQRRRNLMAALDVYGCQEEEAFQQSWLKESQDMFQAYFGFYSKSFIPPAYTWHTRIVPVLQEMKCEAIQGIGYQYEAYFKGSKRYKKIKHFTGTSTGNGIMRLARNVAFEPATAPAKDWADAALKEVAGAFASSQPAIISMHRINFSGRLSPDNAERNLKVTEQFLSAILKKWPDVQFLHTIQLLEKIKAASAN